MYINFIAKHLFEEIAARNHMREQEVEGAIVRQYRADLTSADPLLRESWQDLARDKPNATAQDIFDFLVRRLGSWNADNAIVIADYLEDMMRGFPPKQP